MNMHNMNNFINGLYIGLSSTLVIEPIKVSNMSIRISMMTIITRMRSIRILFIASR